MASPAAARGAEGAHAGCRLIRVRAEGEPALPVARSTISSPERRLVSPSARSPLRAKLSEGELAARLRAGSPGVIGRVQEGKLLLDLRCVFERQEEQLLAALRQAVE